MVKDATRAVIYTPPQGNQRLRDLLSNWERFMHDESDLDALVRMAAGHYQFEAIHPFIDGNGRTGRVLNSLYLIEAGLLGSPILYLGRYLIEHKGPYYQKLLDVTARNDWEGWLLFMLEGVEETAVWTLGKIGAVWALVDETAAQIQTASAYLKRLADIGVLRPVKSGRSKLFVHERLLRLLTHDANEFESYSS